MKSSMRTTRSSGSSSRGQKNPNTACMASCWIVSHSSCVPSPVNDTTSIRGPPPGTSERKWPATSSSARQALTVTGIPKTPRRTTATTSVI